MSPCSLSQRGPRELRKLTRPIVFPDKNCIERILEMKRKVFLVQRGLFSRLTFFCGHLSTQTVPLCPAIEDSLWDNQENNT